MILLYCYDIEERRKLHSYFRDKGVCLEAVPPSDFRIRSYSLSADAIVIAGKVPCGFIFELNPNITLVTIGKYSLGDSINFKDHTDSGLLNLLLSFPDADQTFDYNGILWGKGTDIYYLGYKFNLTKTEGSILSYLVSEKDREVSCEEIAQACIGDPHAKSSTITKHISSINGKAQKIGGRMIIYSPNDHYYKIKKYI